MCLSKPRKKLLFEEVLDGTLESNVSRLEKSSTVGRYKNDKDVWMFIENVGSESHTGMDWIGVNEEHRCLLFIKLGVSLNHAFDVENHVHSTHSFMVFNVLKWLVGLSHLQHK